MATAADLEALCNDLDSTLATGTWQKIDDSVCTSLWCNTIQAQYALQQQCNWLNWLWLVSHAVLQVD